MESGIRQIVAEEISSGQGIRKYGVFGAIGVACLLIGMLVFTAGCSSSGSKGSSANSESQTDVAVSGVVLDSNSKPVPDATVTIKSDPIVATTDGSGKFSAEVPPGNHTITISKGDKTFYENAFTAVEGSPLSLGNLSPTTPYYMDGNPSGESDTQAPTVPGNITATAASSTQINLSWGASIDNVGVTGYKIYRSGVLLKQVTGTSTSDTGLNASTQYCYTVSAGDAAGNWSVQSAQSCASTLAAGDTGDTQAPTVPGSITATAASSTQINLSWGASTDNVGVTGYKIYRAGVFQKQVTGTSTTDTGLNPSTQYCYTVTAGDAAGNWSTQSTQTAQSCATTSSPPDTQAPTVPGNVTATAASSTQINLSWSASTDNVGVTGYKIYRSGVFLKQVTGTSTTDTGLSPSTQDCYTVSAGDTAGNWSAQSTQTTQSCATTSAPPDTQAPTVPGNVTATAASSTQINLSWSASTDNAGVTGYKIYRAGVLLKQVTGTSTTDTGLSPSTQYCYTVSAGDAAGNWSAQSTQTTQSCATTSAPPDTQAPTVPGNVTAVPASSTQINLTWNPSTDNIAVTGYKVYRGGVFLKAVTTTTTTDTGLNPSTQYCYTVSAGDAAGNWSAQSTQTAQSCATTSAPPDTQRPTTPGNITAKAVSSTQINLSWSASTDNVGVTGYQIYRHEALHGSTFSFLKYASGTSTTDTGLDSGSQYCYIIYAYDAAGNQSIGNNPAACATTPITQTFVPTFDNTIVWGIANATYANTVYSSGNLAVGNAFGPDVYGVTQYVYKADALLYYNINSTISGKTIDSAALTLTVSAAPLDLYTTFRASAILNSWSTTHNITWNMGVTYSLAAFADESPTASSITWDITEIVQDWANQSIANNGILIWDISQASIINSMPST